MKKKELWIGQIPDIFGYGMSVVSESKAGAMKALRLKYAEWKRNLGPMADPTTNFKKSFEYFGGYVGKVDLDRVYHDGFNE